MNTLARIVAYKRIVLLLRELGFDGRSRPGIRCSSYTIFVTQRLKSAHAVSRTAHTVKVMVGKQKLEHLLSVLVYPLAVGGYYHPVFGCRAAGRHKVLLAFHLDHAHPAGTDIVYILEKAKRGDLYSESRSSRKNSCSRLDHSGLAVDSQIDHVPEPPTIEPQP